MAGNTGLVGDTPPDSQLPHLLAASLHGVNFIMCDRYTCACVSRSPTDRHLTASCECRPGRRDRHDGKHRPRR